MVANRKFSSSLEQFHPVLHWRLMEFIEDYSLGDKPALVWQWRPVDRVEVDVTAPAVHDLMSRGAVSSRVQAWWYGFRSSYGIANVFPGLSSTDPRNAAGWAAEVHTDGHLIAGLWSFPELAVDGAPAPCLSDFHMEAFRDFAELSGAAATVIGSTGASCMTASLLAATSLRIVRSGNHWGHQPRPATRDTMQWRVRTGSNDQLRAIGDAMAADYKRAFAF
ncbi:hypothetical protein [Piscinibacter sp.]|uniref:hypothetical protein n=1 Tax=Piscinibacter sp. TaxID=1903157 RepID=UPI0011D50DF6|nr:MAG: hypothetical protein E6Q93_10020 [Burkholderiaceae bacterium]